MEKKKKFSYPHPVIRSKIASMPLFFFLLLFLLPLPLSFSPCGKWEEEEEGKTQELKRKN